MTQPPQENQDFSQETVSSEGYNRHLSRRHIQMIALGGAIGTGLFLGAGSRLQQAGPSLVIVYAICGLCAYMILRAMGELVMYRPSSGSFVTYAREFLGEWAAYTSGWFSFLNWSMTGIADITAIALYVHYWPFFSDIPQWVIALGALIVVGGINLAGVRHFGEIEFWLSLIKILTLIAFLVVGVTILCLGIEVGHHKPGLSLITDSGGVFPHGIIVPLMLIQGVIFAYAGTEIIGVAAGECEDPRKVIPRAVNSVIWRISLFYVGSIALLVLVLPWTEYKAGVSPFVTFFQKLGVPGIDNIMNFVVMMAALSSLNSGLYSTGRVLRALSLGGSGPRILSRLSQRSVPYVGILATLFIYLIGVGLNYLIPAQVFEVVLSLSSLGILGTWAFIVICQLQLHKHIQSGEIASTGFDMPWAPYSGWITIAFLVFIVGMMIFDYPSGTFAVLSIPFLTALFCGGWAVAKRQKRIKTLQDIQ